MYLSLIQPLHSPPIILVSFEKKFNITRILFHGCTMYLSDGAIDNATWHFLLPNSELLRSGLAVLYVCFLAFILGCSFTIFRGVFIPLLLLYLTSFSCPGFSLHHGETCPLTASQQKVCDRKVCMAELFTYYGHI